MSLKSSTEVLTINSQRIKQVKENAETLNLVETKL